LCSDFVEANQFVVNLWSYRGLALNFFQREISGRYIGSVSGIFWILIHPLALLGIYSVVFTAIFRVNLPDMAAGSFVAFVALALWPWLAFQEGMLRGALAVQANAGLVKKVAFPNELLVHGAVLATYTVHGIGFLAALGVIALVGNSLHFEALPLVLILLLMQLLFTAGLALGLSALQVLIKDVEHFLTPFLMIWFYATPVLYSATMVPARLQQLMSLNPIGYSVGRIRELLMHGGGLIPSDGALLLGAVLVFVLGRWFFNRLAPHFEDFL
jgi:lipopolysaccharide transport system permease protein